MPNLCNYELIVQGKKKNVKTFIDWMSADYCYDKAKSEVYIVNKNNEKVPVKHHIGYRVFECNTDFNTEFANNNDNDIINCYCFGDVAWSVYSTVFVGKHTYLGDANTIKYSHPLGWFKENDILINKIKIVVNHLYDMFRHRKAISLPKACKLLNLKVEVYSRETGMCFAEHYYIDKGKVIVDESTEYTEDWVDDYSTYEEYVENNEKPVSKEIYEYWVEDQGEVFIPRCEWLEPKRYDFEYKYL